MTIDSISPISAFRAFEITVPSPITVIAISAEFLFAGNFHGYVKVWLRRGNRLEEIRRFRAHLDGVTGICYSVGHQIVVTAGLDEEIRVWKMEPFEMIGELGKIWKWRLDNPITWRTGDAPKDDPRHFLEPVEVEQPDPIFETDKKEEPRQTVTEKPVVTPFSFEMFEREMLELEQVYLTSRENAKIATMRPDDAPRTARVFMKGPSPLMDRELKRARVSKPRIWKPKI
jgi:hypothetical protein